MTAIRSPAIAGQYLRWLAAYAIYRRPPVLRLRDQISLGSFVNFSEYHKARHFFTDAELELFCMPVDGQGSIIDIGANIGALSLLLAKRSPDRIIHALEPNPSTFRSLIANVALNDFGNVKCHELAIAERSGSLLFNADPVARGTASIAQGSEPHVMSVACKTLDDFCAAQGVSRIELLKVDVEGHETSVFRGASRVLTSVRPGMIYFEVCPSHAQRCGFEPSEPARILLEHGYTLRRLDAAQTLVPATLDDVMRVHTANWIALSR